jgi:hypothetical protein
LSKLRTSLRMEESAKPLREGNRTIKSANELNRLASYAVKQIYAEFIRRSSFDTIGKTAEEIKKQFDLWLKNETNVFKKNGLLPIIDYKSTILLEARAYKKAKKYSFAILLYSTWVEHLLNELIENALMKRHFSPKDIAEVIRDNNIKSKTTWLIRLLNYPPIKKNCRDAINKLIERRNMWVHYKWKPIPTDDIDPKDEEESIVNEFEKTIKYLNNYHRRNIYKNAKLSPPWVV